MSAFSRFINRSKDALKSGFKRSKELLKSGLKRSGSLLKSGLQRSGSLLKSGLESGFKRSRDAFKSGFRRSKDAFKSGFRRSKDAFKSGLERSGELLKSGFNRSKDAIKSGLKRSRDLLKSGFKRSRNMFKRTPKTKRSGDGSSSSSSSMSGGSGSISGISSSGEEDSDDSDGGSFEMIRTVKKKLKRTPEYIKRSKKVVMDVLPDGKNMMLTLSIKSLPYTYSTIRRTLDIPKPVDEYLSKNITTISKVLNLCTSTYTGKNKEMYDDGIFKELTLILNGLYDLMIETTKNQETHDMMVTYKDQIMSTWMTCSQHFRGDRDYRNIKLVKNSDKNSMGKWAQRWMNELLSKESSDSPDSSDDDISLNEYNKRLETALYHDTKLKNYKTQLRIASAKDRERLMEKIYKRHGKADFNDTAHLAVNSMLDKLATKDGEAGIQLAQSLPVIYAVIRERTGYGEGSPIIKFLDTYIQNISNIFTYCLTSTSHDVDTKLFHYISILFNNLYDTVIKIIPYEDTRNLLKRNKANFARIGKNCSAHF